MDVMTASVIGASVAIGLGTIGTGLGQGLAVMGAMNGMSRQPEASGKIGTNMIIGLAIIESLAIYALVVALIILLANPMLKTDDAVAREKASVEKLNLQLENLKLQQQIDALKQAEKH